MKKIYQFLIDVFLTDDIEDGEVVVVSGCVKAENAEEARDVALEMMKAGKIEDAPENYTQLYVWEISEDDVVEEDVSE